MITKINLNNMHAEHRVWRISGLVLLLILLTTGGNPTHAMNAGECVAWADSIRPDPNLSNYGEDNTLFYQQTKKFPRQKVMYHIMVHNANWTPIKKEDRQHVVFSLHAAFNQEENTETYKDKHGNEIAVERRSGYAGSQADHKFDYKGNTYTIKIPKQEVWTRETTYENGRKIRNEVDIHKVSFICKVTLIEKGGFLYIKKHKLSIKKHKGKKVMSMETF